MHGGQIAIAELALAGDPYSADLTYGLGAMYHVSGNEPASQEMARRFVKLAPRSVLLKGQPK